MGRRLAVLVVVFAALASTSAGAAAHVVPRTGVNGKSDVLPALMNAAYGGYTTAIYVENVSHVGSTANITITYFDATGAVAGTGDSAAIPFWGERTFRQDNGHSFAMGSAGSGVVTSDQEVAVFVNEFAPGAGADGTSYTSIQLPEGAAIAVYAPTIVNNAYGGYTTGIGLTNPGAVSDSLSVTYRDAAGTLVKTTMLTLAPHAYAGLYSGDPGLALPSGFIGTATIVAATAGQIVAAVVNEIGPGGQFTSYDAVADVQNTLYIPAAMHNAYGGFNTGIGIFNAGDLTAHTTVTYYDAAGNPAGTPVAVVIARGGYSGVYQGGADGPPQSAAGYTAVITSDQPLAAIVNEIDPTGKLATSFNAETAGSGYLNFALVENAGSDGWTTGLALMNITNSMITFTLTYFDAATGSGITAIPLSLPAHGYMGRYTPSDLTTPGTRATAWFFSSTPGLAGIANEAGAGTLMSFNGQ